MNATIWKSLNILVPKNNIVGILEFRNSADPTLEMSEELEQMLKTSANFCHTF